MAELLWLPALAALLAGRRKLAAAFAPAATIGTFLTLPSNWGQLVLQVATLAAIAGYPKPVTVHTRGRLPPGSPLSWRLPCGGWESWTRSAWRGF